MVPGAWCPNQGDPSGLRLGDRGPCTLIASSCGGEWWEEIRVWGGSGQGGGVSLGCRPLNDPRLGKVSNHCAISVTVNGKTYFAELLNVNKQNAIILVEARFVDPSYWNRYTWVSTPYASPSAIYGSILANQEQYQFDKYHFEGQQNSNHWVWEVFRDSGTLLKYGSSRISVQRIRGKNGVK
jgi:hypothetical protein